MINKYEIMFYNENKYVGMSEEDLEAELVKSQAENAEIQRKIALLPCNKDVARLKLKIAEIELKENE